MLPRVLTSRRSHDGWAEIPGHCRGAAPSPPAARRAAARTTGLRWPTAAGTLVLLWGCGAATDSLPADYRRVAVPHELLARQDARRRGRALFVQHCAICHGEAADGRGVRRNLSSRPSDFTDPNWRRQASPRWVFYVIREGLPGTAMAAWKGLDEDETWDLVAYVLSVADAGPP